MRSRGGTSVVRRTAILSMSLAICATPVTAESPTSWKTGPATCAVWNEHRPNSLMRRAMAHWVRAYLSPANGRGDALRGHSVRDFQRLLNDHCRVNPTDNIQRAADALEQEALAKVSAPGA